MKQLPDERERSLQDALQDLVHAVYREFPSPDYPPDHPRTIAIEKAIPALMEWDIFLCWKSVELAHDWVPSRVGQECRRCGVGLLPDDVGLVPK